MINFLLLLSSLQGSADTHSLEYQYTALTPSYTGFPEFTAVGLLDGRQFMSYSSSHMKLIPEQWIKKSKKEEYWRNEEEDMHGHQYDFNDIFTTIKNQFDHSTGDHTLQRRYGCEINDDGTTKRYDQYGYDGEDFISLDLNTGTWNLSKPQAEIIKQKWESTGYTQYWKNFLEHACMDLLYVFVTYSRETLDRKVPPTASVFQKHSSPPDVVCHATGFFPKSLMISWQKDGVEVHKDLSKALPNQDGSFQKRSVLKVSAEDLQKHNYTCVIQYSSLEKEMVLEVPKGGGSGGEPGVGLISAGLIANIVLFAVVVVGIIVWLIKRGKRRPAAETQGHLVEMLKMQLLNRSPANQNSSRTPGQSEQNCNGPTSNDTLTT